MASSVATFPLLIASEEDDTTNFLKRARELAREEKVSLLQYMTGMLKHAIRGHDLSKIHFYQDDSGDTYNEDDLDRMHEEALAESAAGLTTVCNTTEEALAHLEKLKAEADDGEEID